MNDYFPAHIQYADGFESYVYHTVCANVFHFIRVHNTQITWYNSVLGIRTIIQVCTMLHLLQNIIMAIYQSFSYFA